MDDKTNNDWRKLTAVLYRKPNDSKIFGSVEIDVTEVETFIKNHRQNGLKITLTQILLLAFARGLQEAAPEINCYVSRGRIIQRKQVDVSLSVLANNGQMTSIKVMAAEKMTLQTLNALLQQELLRTRQNMGAHVKQAKNMLVKIPWPFRQWVADLILWLTIDLGISLPFLGITPHTFGSFVFSNLGSIGLDIGYPALAPFANVGMVVTQGSITTKPWVVDGQIVPRRILIISAALDHRVVDGAQIGQLFKYLRQVLNDPRVLENKP